MSYYVHADKFFFKNTTENGGYLEVTADQKFGKYFAEDEKPEGEIKEYAGKWIAPGLVDTHIHGTNDHDVMDNDWDGVNNMSVALLQTGVTSWLPTTLTSSFEKLNAVCKTIGDNYETAEGAKIAGIHLEGPYFTEEHKGAQNPKYFKDPSIAEFDQWQESAHGIVKKIAMAAERDGVEEFIQHVTKDGKTVVSIGHTSATLAEVSRAVKAGASVFTHLYNGMRGLHHREPGVLGAALTLKDTDAELICDGHHVHPYAVRLAIETKTQDHIALITDCMRAGLKPDGDYVLGELPVYVADGMARLKSDNNLAGSILKLNDAIKNVVDWNIATPEEAIKMASATAARSCHIDDVCGEIKEGRGADFIVLNPDMALVETYLDGVSRFQA